MVFALAKNQNPGFVYSLSPSGNPEGLFVYLAMVLPCCRVSVCIVPALVLGLAFCTFLW